MLAPVQLVRAWIERIVEMEGIDRAVVLGAQAFTALFPLLIVYASATSPGGESSFAERLIDRFDISGSSADSLRQAFAPQEPDSGVKALSVVLVIVSALAFTRAMQRLYERAWRIKALGMRATGWGLLWLACVVVFASVRNVVDGELQGLPDVAVSLALSTLLWIGSPFVLLARRVPWRRLLPGALLTAAAMLVFSGAIVVGAPRTFGTAAAEYGLIGVAFAIVGWLVGAAMVIMASAALGAVVAEGLDDAA
jgi:membrane protein